MSATQESTEAADRRFVVVASRLPVDRTEGPDGGDEWRPSPGGLVTALEPVMREAGGAWIGWSGDAGPAPGPFEADGLHLVGLGLSEAEVRYFYEGFCNATLWPLYHDVIAPPQFHRRWWDAYVMVNRRFARAAADQAAPGATVWVHDYQLQLVPRMLREQRRDVRIGFFNHIPFPGYEIFAQLPWRRQVVEGLLGADLLGFQRRADAANFLRACRRAVGLTTRGSTVRVDEPGGPREIQAAAFPISIDAGALAEIARREDVRKRAREIREALGEPALVLLGVDRLDYTKGILHRLRAYGELLDDGRLGPRVVLIQVASPSRERVEAYQTLRDEVEVTVGRINGQHGEVGYSPVHYLHQSYPREEMAALYLAADVMLVTPLRDGMNLVAKEYVATRYDEGGTLVLSEFTGAADELAGAFGVNPHDIEGLKNAIVRAATATPQEARRRMRAMRRRVSEHDVARWAASFLNTLARVPSRPVLRAGQDEGHLGAVSRLAAGGQPAAVGLGHLGGDRQADAAAGDLGRLPAPPEPVEDAGQVLGGDALAGVGDLQHRLAARRTGADGDVAARRGELQRVGEQVRDQLVQPVRVGEHRAGGQPAVQRDARRLEAAGQAVGRRGGQAGQVAALPRQVERGGVGGGQRLQVTHHPRQPQDLVAQRAELGEGGFGHAVEQGLVTRLQDGDGGAQFVGDVGDQVAADLFLPVQGACHLVEGGGQLT
jgi:trehalose 6-phosphate synthase